jgi:hypothetical protein
MKIEKKNNIIGDLIFSTTLGCAVIIGLVTLICVTGFLFLLFVSIIKPFLK